MFSAGKEVANEEENRNATRERVFKKETKAAEVNGILLLFLFLFSFFFDWFELESHQTLFSIVLLHLSQKSKHVGGNKCGNRYNSLFFFYCFLSTFKSSFL